MLAIVCVTTRVSLACATGAVLGCRFGEVKSAQKISSLTQRELERFSLDCLLALRNPKFGFRLYLSFGGEKRAETPLLLRELLSDWRAWLWQIAFMTRTEFDALRLRCKAAFDAYHMHACQRD
jgi:hypothetical protein